MKNKIEISGFADEIAEDLETQISVVKKLGISYIEMRGVNGKPLVEHSLEEVKEIKKQLDKHDAYPILTFIKQMEQLEISIPAFLFTTCGLYSANTLRIFAKLCEKKNMITILSRSYRCAATDGILLAPAMRI